MKKTKRFAHNKNKRLITYKGQQIYVEKANAQGIYALLISIGLCGVFSLYPRFVSDGVGYVQASEPASTEQSKPTSEPTTIPITEVIEITEPEPTSEVETGFEHITEYIYQVFGDDGEMAVKIAKCESRLNPETVGDKHIMVLDPKHDEMVGDSIGIFQVRSGGKEKNGHIWNRARANGMTADEFRATMRDYRKNIDYAKQIFDRNGWNAWYNCNNKVN